MNLLEETGKADVNGIYHSGNLAKKLPDGNLVLLGRSNDMIKINGNRIEPAEIEAAVKNALGIDWVAAKGFTDLQKVIVLKALLKQRKGNASDLDALTKVFEKIR